MGVATDVDRVGFPVPFSYGPGRLRTPGRRRGLHGFDVPPVPERPLLPPHGGHRTNPAMPERLVLTILQHSQMYRSRVSKFTYEMILEIHTFSSIYTFCSSPIDFSDSNKHPHGMKYSISVK